MIFFTLVEDKRLHKSAGNGATNSFRSAAKNAIKYYINVPKTGTKCRKRLITRNWCEIRQNIDISELQRQRCLRIYRVKNIGNVLEYSGVAFRLPHLMVGLLFAFHKSRLEEAGDVISGVALEWVRMDVRAKFGDSRLNTG